MSKYNVNLVLIVVYFVKITFSTFAEEEKLTHSKVLLLTENSLNKEFTNLDEMFSNTLSARLSDVRMGVITPDIRTSGIRTKKELKLLSAVKLTSPMTKSDLKCHLILNKSSRQRFRSRLQA